VLPWHLGVSTPSQPLEVGQPLFKQVILGAATSHGTNNRVARGLARLSPAAVAEREQAERKEQQWQKENMATAHHEHDHGNCKADSKYTHQRIP
jgi:hypothetical protein